MERTQVLELMSTLKLYGMRSAYDEVMGNGIKRQHEPPRIVGDLLQSEIAEKQARSIRYQLSIAKLPLAKDIDDFDFADTPVNESLVRELATGTFVADQRNVVLVGGTKGGAKSDRTPRSCLTHTSFEKSAGQVPAKGAIFLKLAGEDQARHPVQHTGSSRSPVRTLEQVEHDKI